MTIYEIPPSTNLFCAIRDLGYSPQAAIADIIDNSLSAKAKTININIKWDETVQPFITITDDGVGMNKASLLEAMDLAGTYLKSDRAVSDLGRFGLGLKTAGTALGTQLSVITYDGVEITDATWDLIKISKDPDKKWSLVVNEGDEQIQQYREQLSKTKSGTVVLIRDLDKFVIGTNADEVKKQFYKNINNIQKHLGLVFHRFIYEDGVKIFVNSESPLEPWDPFLSNWPETSPAYRAVDELDEKTIIGKNGNIKIQSFVLPHKSKFESIDTGLYSYNQAGGPYGWHANQGFYLYRNRRLIMHGNWFGVIEKSKFYDLARVKIDISPSQDVEWQINIDKTKATPPSDVKQTLKQIAENCAKKSMEIYNSRASSNHGPSRPSLAAAWEQRRSTSGVYSYLVNKKHPLYIKLLQVLDSNDREIFNTYIQLIENYSPIVQMGFCQPKNIDARILEEEKEKDVLQMKQIIKGFVKAGCDVQEIKQTIIDMPKYSYLKNDFDTIYQGVMND